jgi:tRNA A-37 threonylcarbamoyl transferase component Bud32
MAEPSTNDVAAPAAAAWKCPVCGNSYPADFALCPRDATARPATSGGSDPLIGTVLGNTYRIVKLIGEGGMARLYMAEHLRVDAKFAVKVIHHDLASDPELLARFEREARAAGRIHSEHVVAVIDVLRTPHGRPCIVTELLDGEDLQAHLDRIEDNMKPEVAIPIVRQICRAVAAAHAVGVVHRDMKPSNVFLCRGPELKVKVFDFGVAKLEDDDRLTRTDAVVGTAAYMSPEQARRAVDAGPLSDIYSIGAVLYHMVAGEPPYGSAPPVSRFAMLLHEEPARPRELEPTIPPAVEAVIQRAMARDPKSRVQTALDLEAELAELDVQPATTPAPAPEPGSTAPVSRATTAAGATMVTRTGATGTDVVRRARMARPMAGFLAVASSLAAGAWVAALLAVLVGIPDSGGERSMVGLFAAVAVATIAVVHVRVLRKRWRSAPAVLRHNEPVARALLAGVLTFGALDLMSTWTLLVFRGELFGFTARVVFSGIAAGIGLGWRRFGWDERFRKRFG